MRSRREFVKQLKRDWKERRCLVVEQKFRWLIAADYPELVIAAVLAFVFVEAGI